MKYVLDTNIVIYLQNGLLIEPLPVAEYAISVITESQALWLKQLISDIQVIGLNDPIKEQTIKLRKERSLKLPDAIVCATAINEQAVLLTNDKKIHALDGL